MGNFIRNLAGTHLLQGEAYASFLKQLLELTACLKEWGLQEQVYFHISDEPEWEQKEAMEQPRDLVKPYIEGFQMLDALSHYNFYETGLLEQPVCAIDHLTPFLEKRPEKLWTYYCCGQKRAVPNRFMAQHLQEPHSGSDFISVSSGRIFTVGI